MLVMEFVSVKETLLKTITGILQPIKDISISNLDTPLQILTAYNSIADNEIHQVNIDSLKQALRYMVTDDLG